MVKLCFYFAILSLACILLVYYTMYGQPDGIFVHIAYMYVFSESKIKSLLRNHGLLRHIEMKEYTNGSAKM